MGLGGGGDRVVHLLEDGEFGLFEVLEGEVEVDERFEGLVGRFDGALEVRIAVGVEVEVAGRGVVARSAAIGTPFLTDLAMEGAVVHESC